MRRLCPGAGDEPCSELTEPDLPRCTGCQAQHLQRRNTRYNGTWPAQAKADIARYRASHGDTCPGWQRDPHPIDHTDWTCDHDLGPLCRACNGAKGGSWDKIGN